MSSLPAESVREPRVLVVGQVEGAVESTLDNGSSIHSCRHMLEAISLAGHERFDAIFVVLNGLDAHLESALMTLRRASHGARLVVLATMAEEVRARTAPARGREPPRPSSPATRGGRRDWRGAASSMPIPGVH
ncbi:MAG TPA: hypothetical protein ENO19_07105, partial [Halothiobacillaceae bacterium]|nr:hypothetical protein [Halothiobacillaceae bacterium]